MSHATPGPPLLGDATLGKIAAKVRVVRRDGTPLPRAQAWWRAILRMFFVAAWLAVRFRIAVKPAEYS